MVRSILGVVIGAAVWMAGFFVLTILLAQLWPDYAIHGRQWIEERAFTFTPAMACANLALWVVAELGAGSVTARIARRAPAVWVLAGLVGCYLGAVHLLLEWSRFPWWYDLGVVIPAVPAVLLGGRLAKA
ncbi:MAG TPA: hypothetical protein VMU44_10220 [Steroidobacteraceae bacterium]|nr:hypothetical protein [Steroidobacteraceae bacterium]